MTWLGLRIVPGSLYGQFYSKDFPWQNQFTLTTQIQEKDGWKLHPLDEQLRGKQANRKLRSIPVRMLFNDAELNFCAEYSMFDRANGRPVCVGNGDKCRRLTQSGVQVLPCPGPTICEFGKNGLCKPYGRLNVLIGDEERAVKLQRVREVKARLKSQKTV